MPPNSFFYPLVKLLEVMVYLNAFLAIFNLLPVPPLDGSRILPSFCHPQEESFTKTMWPYGSMILLALIFTGGLSWMLPIVAGFVGVRPPS